MINAGLCTKRKIFQHTARIAPASDLYNNGVGLSFAKMTWYVAAAIKTNDTKKRVFCDLLLNQIVKKQTMDDKIGPNEETENEINKPKIVIVCIQRC